MARPLHPRILARIRAGLIVGSDGAPDPRTIRLRWRILIHDRTARRAESRAALKSLPDGDAA